jgi:hypothetical protein
VGPFEIATRLHHGRAPDAKGDRDAHAGHGADAPGQLDYALEFTGPARSVLVDLERVNADGIKLDETITLANVSIEVAAGGKGNRGRERAPGSRLGAAVRGPCAAATPSPTLAANLCEPPT